MARDLVKIYAFKLTVILSIGLACCPVYSQTGQDLDSIIKQASKECRNAKILRRSDLSQAQTSFKEYVKLLNQAIAIKPNLLDNPDVNTQRVLDFCNVVKSDLDRAEALPLFERGIRECGEARVLISNAAFDEARDKYRLYREYKEGALVISESVLDVYENSYEIRLCDRLSDDIAKAEDDYRKQLKAATAEQEDVYKPVLDKLTQADRQCRGAQNLVDDKDSYNLQTVTQVESLAKDSVTLRDAALAGRDKLAAQGKNPSDAIAAKISSALVGIRECQGAIPGNIARIKAALVAKSKSTASSGNSKQKINQDYRQIVGAPTEYPRRALKRNIEGHVTVKFDVTKTGDVANIEIVESEPQGYFEDAVIEAVEKYKFQPRIVNGDSVDTKGIVKRLVFKLQ